MGSINSTRKSIQKIDLKNDGALPHIRPEMPLEFYKKRLNLEDYDVTILSEFRGMEYLIPLLKEDGYFVYGTGPDEQNFGMLVISREEINVETYIVDISDIFDEFRNTI